MDIYLGLGSNLGDRRKNISEAIRLLERSGVTILKISPIIETPALLIEDSPSEWDLPFLNIVIFCRVSKDPELLYLEIKKVESQLGRVNNKKWSPRSIDIDILTWGDKIISSENLSIPHPKLKERNFVLTPLLSLNPKLRIPGINKNIIDLSTSLENHIPLWMGILNITPDSFSDGGIYKNIDDINNKINKMVESGVNIIDIGGESTRPNAQIISSDEEWERISPVLQLIKEKKENNLLYPFISVDTYHPETAIKAIELDVEIINDVSGLTNPEMQEVAKTSKQDWIVMHNLGIPANKEKIIADESLDKINQTIDEWLIRNIKIWEKSGIDLSRIIFDPGIGFGKNSSQSYKILSCVGRFKKHGLRTIVGHSRKSFLNNISINKKNKDVETLGISMKLLKQKVDILRVHNVKIHTQAYRSWLKI
jgi:2-amino-4-hydroxy-6-hydroxymethyldihydropteridine diphosphokinase/dihydropteroate synthase